MPQEETILVTENKKPLGCDMTYQVQKDNKIK
ncbi:hypothetical protein CPL00366_CDS0021 [Klebsiella phage RareGolfball]